MVAVVVTTAAEAAPVAAAVATTAVALVAGRADRAADMVAVTKVVLAQAHHAPVGVIDVSRPMDAVVAAQAEAAVMAAATAAADTEIAAARVAADSQVIVDRHLRAVALALAAVQAIVMA